jgi:hypothetical protein
MITPEEQTEQRKEDRKPRLDGTVTFGNILTVISIILGGFLAWSQNQIIVTRLEVKQMSTDAAMVEVKTAIVTLNATLQLALQNQARMAVILEHHLDKKPL